VKPSEIGLFSPKEQALLVSTERARLAELSEDELGDLLALVRRGRNKYSKLHRRQASASVDAAGKRYAATTSNVRTLRKAEIFEESLARVSQALGRAAKASADELKRERLALAAGGGRATGATSERTRRSAPPSRAGAATPAKPSRGDTVTARRVASTTASTARRQATRDAR
jgi:hypothetical protein